MRISFVELSDKEILDLQQLGGNPTFRILEKVFDEKRGQLIEELSGPYARSEDLLKASGALYHLSDILSVLTSAMNRELNQLHEEFDEPVGGIEDFYDEEIDVG